MVGIDPAVAAQIAAVRGEMQRLALFISGHQWINDSGNRFAAWKTVDDAAKTSAAQ